MTLRDCIENLIEKGVDCIQLLADYDKAVISHKKGFFGTEDDFLREMRRIQTRALYLNQLLKMPDGILEKTIRLKSDSEIGTYRIVSNCLFDEQGNSGTSHVAVTCYNSLPSSIIFAPISDLDWIN